MANYQITNLIMDLDTGFTCFLSSVCDKMTAKRRRLNTMVRTHMPKRAFEIPVEPPVGYFDVIQIQDFLEQGHNKIARLQDIMGLSSI